MSRSFQYTLLLFFWTLFSMGQQSVSDAGITEGALSVSLSGAATYQVPIAVPPGVRDIAPAISLNYNSQSGNGIAGWGWNIGGLSTITRIPSTLFHDGVIDPVDFDGNDRYALDGQRLLLKSGTYGANNAAYETENYSNTKIISYGVSRFGASYGPRYFVVFHPDGSRAWYGQTNDASGRLEWAINKWQDPQGNFINYKYAQHQNLLRITEISYGSRNTTAAPNKVSFSYKTRARRESSYVGGVFFERRYILEQINSSTTNTTYRSYYLKQGKFTNNILEYERPEYLQERVGSRALERVRFNYANITGNNISRYSDDHQAIRDINPEDDEVFIADVTGDGTLDVLTYDRNARNRIKVISNFLPGASQSGRSTTFPKYEKEVSVSPFDALVAGKILNSSDKVIDQDGFFTIRQQRTAVNGSTNNVTFTGYVMGSSGASNQYQRTWQAPTAKWDNNCNDRNNRIIPKSYLSGDFNGDGLLDVLAVTGSYTERTCSRNRNDCDGGDDDIDLRITTEEDTTGDVIDPNSTACCSCTERSFTTKNAYFIDLNRNKTSSNFANFAGPIPSSNANSQLFTLDYDGDGKTDLAHLTNGRIVVYSLNNTNGLRQIAQFNDTDIDNNELILTGDFNGDGKFDFVTPEGENSRLWNFFFSDGVSFKKETSDLGFPYEKSRIVGSRIYEHHYITQDFNGDGKTDILVHDQAYLPSINPQGFATTEEVSIYHNQGLVGGTLQLAKTTTSSTTPGNLTRGFPMALPGGRYTQNNAYLYVRSGATRIFTSAKDHRTDTRLNNIRTYGNQYSIRYDKVLKYATDEFSATTHTPKNNLVYPYANINTSTNFTIVGQIEHSTFGVSRKRNFRYEGAMSHHTGLGFLGFQTLHQSNWWGDEVTRLWTSSKHSATKRGAVTQRWTANNLAASPTNPISETSYTYDTNLRGNKVFVNVPTAMVVDDRLHGTTTTSNYTYDSYYNPTRTVTNNGAKRVQEDFTYFNNPGANSSAFHIGRIRTSENRSTLNGHTFYSRVEYTYNGNLVKDRKTRGSGTATITESFTYDAWGNPKSTILKGSGMQDRSSSYTYTSDGRFLRTETDVDGLVTSYVYDAKNGNLTSYTDPYNNRTQYSYDAWNRVTTETDYLGNTTTTSYNNLGPHSLFETMVRYAGGGREREITNALGLVIYNGSLGLSNREWGNRYFYDDAGRNVGVTEPFRYTGSLSVSNLLRDRKDYDEYGRVIESREYTGRTVTITHNGLETTAYDGQRTVTRVLDADGNIKEHTDNGGTITYRYFGNGSLRETNFGGQKTTVTIDGWGRKTKLVDPSAGVYEYQYNLFGETLLEKTPNGESTYKYDPTGKLERKTIKGMHTNLEMDFVYNSDQLLQNIMGQDLENNGFYNYTYGYDGRRRLNRMVEDNNAANFKTDYTYDSFGRISKETYTSRLKSNSTQAIVRVRNAYDADSGILKEILNDANSQSLWKLKAHDARFQATDIDYGNGFEGEYEYDEYGFPKEITESKGSGNSTTHALRLSYEFNASRRTLNKRTNTNMGWQENFGHDALDRLTNISGSVSRSQAYNSNGTIKTNSLIGGYDYAGGKKYQLAGLDLNTNGQSHFQGRALQRVTYNAFKLPVAVHEENKGRVDFVYGPLMNRAHAYYGGLDEDIQERRYHKHYSAISPVEIVEDKQANTTKIITYVGGDAYTAPVANILQKSNNTVQEYHYLHRDYLGSILAISDASGNIEEQRQFGAWGTVDRFLNSSGNAGSFDHQSLLGRGYTGHEHFFEVGLIHMNGRMYDATLGRFLSPDNYVQEPFNTQSYNRYGYVFNNPLMFTDPSGEFAEGLAPWAISLIVGGFLTAAAIIYPELTNIDAYGFGSPLEHSAPTPSQPRATETASGSQGSSTQVGQGVLSNIFNGLSGLGQGLGQRLKNIASGFTAADAVDIATDFIPIVGGVKDIYKGIQSGSWWQVGLGVGSIVADVLTLGTATLAVGATKVAIKQGAKAVAKSTFKTVGKNVDQIVNGTTDVFRAVSKAELDDIAEFGLRTKSGGFETGKLFAPSVEEAAKFGKNNFGFDGLPNTIIKAEVPNSVLDKSFRFGADGMNAISIPAELLKKVKATPLNSSPLIR